MFIKRRDGSGKLGVQFGAVWRCADDVVLLGGAGLARRSLLASLVSGFLIVGGWALRRLSGAVYLWLACKIVEGNGLAGCLGDCRNIAVVCD